MANVNVIETAVARDDGSAIEISIVSSVVAAAVDDKVAHDGTIVCVDVLAVGSDLRSAEVEDCADIVEDDVDGVDAGRSDIAVDRVMMTRVRIDVAVVSAVLGVGR